MVQNFVSEKISLQKKLGSKKILGPKKCSVQKFITSIKSFGYQKNFSQKHFCV